MTALARTETDDRPFKLRAGLGSRSVVLIGMMGAGKSTVGKRLATRLGLPFADADTEIEAAAGMTVAEIFKNHGEPAFRDGEARVIRRLVEGTSQVIATGGGAYMRPETRAIIRERAISVWLKADFDVLMRRVRRRADRPLLKAPDPEGVMRRLIEERYPVYAEADITVLSRDVSQDVIVEEILAALTDHVTSSVSLDSANADPC
ncbi:shikimate kinase [Blastochloris viridis]|uniref:Shikimate kinase n=1 Tax=Blastochloris viridis TaxID=1079 RepID=A0A0H5B8U6_BLAVI|nr:shikimate kinase [Blastochloris viridis]ALK08095.1 Shikimate kinase 1 [Blastochloris viridis]BAR98642.1 shikimate kinase I [Blastochloris viridis]CUU44017.1 Shikimate kinase 1 [Blastochloris viridis]